MSYYFFNFNKRLSVVLILLLIFASQKINAQVAGQIPLAPNSVPQFVDPLPHFAGLRVDAKSGGNMIITAMPTQQIAVSTGTVLAGGVVTPNGNIGKANLWAYQIQYGSRTVGPFWPSYTIETLRGVPLNVEYINGLDGERYSNVGLKVDQTLHWADPLNSMHSMSPYGGDPPIVVHLHGGEVKSESDGGPDAWFTPGYTQTGPSWGDGGTDQFYHYPNTQEAATLWYHDHALGVTRLNVYAGMAGYYFLRDVNEDALQLPGFSGDGKVKEVAPIGASGTFNPDPYLPEVEIAIQDRMFDQNGQLYYLNLPPNPMEHPYWTPEFVGDIITVNGKTWPYLSVAPRKYRFRILNGSNARFYELWLQDLATGTFGPTIYQIGTDGGFLDAPVAIDPILGQKLLLGPGERADVIVDFSASASGAVWTMRNSGRTPYPFGAPVQGSTTGRIMQFVVNGAMDGPDNSVIPTSLRPTTPLVKLTNFAGALNPTLIPDKKRQLTLNEVMGMGGPLEVLVNNTKWDANGHDVPGLGETEIPIEGTTEVWQIVNLTADAHPIHLHLVQFQLVSRQKFNSNKYNKLYNSLFPASTMIDPMTGLPYPGGVFIGGYGPPKSYDFYATGPNPIYGGNPDITPYLQGPVKPANLNERGWKDTFIMYPGEVTTVVVRFAPTHIPVGAPANELMFDFDPSEGPGYVWHCHIIDHEDNEMMRPYKVLRSSSRPTLAKTGTVLTETTPVNYELQQNYPNPFNPSTVIKFAVPQENSLVSLKIYNSLGEEVGTLLDQIVPAGNHQVNFDAGELSSGVYFYTLKAGNFVESKKMVLMK